MRSPTQPLVSIIITNYNYGRFLSEAVDSALQQTYQPVEVIIVDDGSTDESHQIIASYKTRVTALYNSHLGQCAATNAGFRASRGDIVIFLDADDYLMPNSVARHVENFNNFADIAKSQGYMQCVDANGNEIARRIPHHLSPTGNYAANILNQGPWVCAHTWTSGNAWRREFLNRAMPLPEDQHNKNTPDGCLNTLAALYGPIASMAEPIAYYRIHGSNMGPVSYEFSVTSLRREIQRMQGNYRFIAERAAAFGITVPLDYWWRWKKSWRSNLAVYALALLDPTEQAPSLGDIVLSPFKARGLSSLKCGALCILLLGVCGIPRKLKLTIIQKLLRLNKTGNENPQKTISKFAYFRQRFKGAR